MQLTTNTKFFIRWVMIFLVVGFYLSQVLLITLDFGITIKYKGEFFQDSISVETCRAIAHLYEEYFDRLLVVSFTWALIAMALILIIFKKIR